MGLPLLRSTKLHFKPAAGELHVFANKFLGRLALAFAEVTGREGQGFLERLVAAMPQIAFNIRRITGLIDVLEDEAMFLGHGFIRSRA
jgi:hypothetical protein